MIKLLIIILLFICPLAAHSQVVVWQASGDTAKPVPSSQWYMGALGFVLPNGSILSNADTSSFNASEVRKAIYISGATANDAYSVTIRNTSEILPVAGDLPSAYAKTDSLIVNRAAGTTANLKFSYTRFKR